MLGRGPRDPARQPFELGEHRVAALLEVGDHRLDVGLALVRIGHDPLRLALGLLAGLVGLGLGLRAGALRVRLGLGPCLAHVRVSLRSRLAGVGVGLLARLLRVLVGGRSQPLGGHVRVDELLARVRGGVLADRLRRVVGLGENSGGLLADPLELRAHGLDGGVALTAALEPVGELSQELVDLAAVVTAHGVREGGVANALERVLVHGVASLRLDCFARVARTFWLGYDPGATATGLSPE